MPDRREKAEADARSEAPRRAHREPVPAIERTVGWLLLGAAAFFLVQAARLTGLVPT